MGCDGYLKNIDRPKEIGFTCYECGKAIDHNYPREGHEGCVKETDRGDVLKVNLDIDDYEER